MWLLIESTASVPARAQEVLASQLLTTLKRVWEAERVPLWVRPVRVVVLGRDAGLVEPVLNSVSLHQIKRQHAGKRLLDYYLLEFGGAVLDGDLLRARTSERFLSAQRAFVESCAAYSVLSYLLQLKDRCTILVHYTVQLGLRVQSDTVHMLYSYKLFATLPFGA